MNSTQVARSQSTKAVVPIKVGLQERHKGVFEDNGQKILRMVCTDDFGLVYRVDQQGRFEYGVYNLHTGQLHRNLSALRPLALSSRQFWEALPADVKYTHGEIHINPDSEAPNSISRLRSIYRLSDAELKNLIDALKSEFGEGPVLKTAPLCDAAHSAKLLVYPEWRVVRVSAGREEGLLFTRDQRKLLVKTRDSAGRLLFPESWKAIPLDQDTKSLSRSPLRLLSAVKTAVLGSTPTLSDVLRMPGFAHSESSVSVVERDGGVLLLVPQHGNQRPIYEGAVKGHCIDPIDPAKHYMLEVDGLREIKVGQGGQLSEGSIRQISWSVGLELTGLAVDPQGNFFVSACKVSKGTSLLIYEVATLRRVAEIKGASGQFAIGEQGHTVFVRDDDTLGMYETNFLQFPRGGLFKSKSDLVELLKAALLAEGCASVAEVQGDHDVVIDKLGKNLSDLLLSKFSAEIDQASSSAALEEINTRIVLAKNKETLKFFPEAFDQLDQYIDSRRIHVAADTLGTVFKELRGQLDSAKSLEDYLAVVGGFGRAQEALDKYPSDLSQFQSVRRDRVELEGQINEKRTMLQPQITQGLQTMAGQIAASFSRADSLETLELVSASADVSRFNEVLPMIVDRADRENIRRIYVDGLRTAREQIQARLVAREREEANRVRRITASVAEKLKEIEAELVEQGSRAEVENWRGSAASLTAVRQLIATLPERDRKMSELDLDIRIERRISQIEEATILQPSPDGKRICFVAGRWHEVYVGAADPSDQNARLGAKVPDRDPIWRWNKYTLSLLDKLASELMRVHQMGQGGVMMEGEAGTGKDTLAKMLAYALKRGFHDFTGRSRIQWEDITFDQGFDAKVGTVVHLSRLVEVAMLPGQLIYLNEFSAMNADNQKMFNSLLDRSRALRLTRRIETPFGNIDQARLHPSNIILGGMNPQSYIGTNKMPLDVKSRWTVVPIGYPPEREGSRQLPYEADFYAPFVPSLQGASSAQFELMWDKCINGKWDSPVTLTPAQGHDLEQLADLVRRLNKLRVAYRKMEMGEGDDRVENNASLREGADLASRFDGKATARDLIAAYLLPKASDPKLMATHRRIMLE